MPFRGLLQKPGRVDSGLDWAMRVETDADSFVIMIEVGTRSS